MGHQISPFGPFPWEALEQPDGSSGEAVEGWHQAAIGADRGGGRPGITSRRCRLSGSGGAGISVGLFSPASVFFRGTFSPSGLSFQLSQSDGRKCSTFTLQAIAHFVAEASIGVAERPTLPIPQLPASRWRYKAARSVGSAAVALGMTNQPCQSAEPLNLGLLNHKSVWATVWATESVN